MGKFMAVVYDQVNSQFFAYFLDYLEKFCFTLMNAQFMFCFFTLLAITKIVQCFTFRCQNGDNFREHLFCRGHVSFLSVSF